MAETAAQKRERMFQEAVEGAKVRRNPRVYQEEQETRGTDSGRSGSIAPAGLVNARLRQQYLDEVEAGATDRPYLDWAKDRAHGAR
jgi:hypothetical protein